MNEIKEVLNEWLDWFETPKENLPIVYDEEKARIGYVNRGFVSSRFICNFDTELVKFEVEILVADKEGEENAAALVKLALVALDTNFPEKVVVSVDDVVADYNGGTLDEFLLAIDKARELTISTTQTIIYP